MKPLTCWATLLLTLCLGLSACHKNPAPAAQSEAPATQAPPAAASTASARAPDPAAAGSAAGAANTVQSIAGVVDPFLTSQLRIFIQQKGRLPESFAEFAGARLDSVPRLAKGLRFVIDPATQEVKIVGQ